jgi:transcriptional regulator with XRE-family HTH domain
MHDKCTLLIMTTHIDHWVPAIESFGVRLVLVRHQMGWNAKEAALACGIAAQNWREWEQSGRRPRDYEGICKQIAARTKCDLIWLMTGTPSTGWPGGQPIAADPNRLPVG